MNKQILKSNSAFAVIGNSPSWTTTEDTGRLLSLVQSYDFSITNDRQKIKQIGNKSYSINDIIKSPEVALNMSYYLTPYINNELLFGFAGSSNSYVPSISGIKDKNQNIYLIIDNENDRDGLYQPRRIDPLNIDFSGYSVMSFGNCYLNKYSLSFDLNGVPVVNVGLLASNVRFEELKTNKVSIPAINSISGNNSGSGFLDLSKFYLTLTSGFVSGDKEGRSEYNPPVAISNASDFYLQNFQVGGVSLSDSANPILQSMSLDLDIQRSSMYGLGSNYVYDRKLQYPVNGQLQFSCLVSGINSGNFQSILTGEVGYSLEIAFKNQNKFNTGFFKIENAKLDSINYSIQINNAMQFNASLSFQANDTGGFLMKRNVG
jgi:hypothetical protein